MKKIVLMVFIVVSLLLSARIYAGAYTYYDVYDSNWHDANNWDLNGGGFLHGTLPTYSDNVWIIGTAVDRVTTLGIGFSEYCKVTGVAYCDWIGLNVNWSNSNSILEILPGGELNIGDPCSIYLGSSYPTGIGFDGEEIREHTGTLRINGGTLNCDIHPSIGALWVGFSSYSKGVIEMNSGIINFKGRLILSGSPDGLAEGEIYMNGGVLNALDHGSEETRTGGIAIGGHGVGRVEIRGGTINTGEYGIRFGNDPEFDEYWDGNGTLLVKDAGKINLPGDWTSHIARWITKGYVNDDVNYSYSIATDTTTMECAAEAFGNLNGDCSIDFKDFAILGQNWLAGN